MKINFTKDNFTRLCELSVDALLANVTVTTNLGSPLNIVELMHTTSINQLNNIKQSLSKKIEKLEAADEWVADPNSEKIEEVRRIRELVNLIIGWKRYNLELSENKKKKEELTKKLAELKESTKTPEDRIKEIEAQLAAMDSTEEFN